MKSLRACREVFEMKSGKHIQSLRACREVFLKGIDSIVLDYRELTISDDIKISNSSKAIHA